MSAPAAYSITELRHGAAYFLVGKAGSALLTFLVFILLAHSLRLDGYGAYATLLAIVELGIGLSNLGLEWAIARHLPGYRLYASPSQLRAFLRMVSLPRVIFLSVIASALFFAHNFVATWFHLAEYQFALKLYAGVLVIEGVARLIRDSILGELMQQKLAQASLIIRNLLLLLGIVWLKIAVWPQAPASHIRLLDVAVVEFISALIGLFLVMYFLRGYLHRLPSRPEAHADWKPVDRNSFWRTASHMYASYLLTLSYGAQVFTFIVNAALGLQAAAVFGFARNLTDLLRKYLPSEIFMTLLRPKLVAAFVASGGDVASLRANSLLAWKISLFVLTPGIIFFAAYGKEFIQLASNGKFTEHSLLVFCMLLSLIPASQRRILELVATILNHPDLCSRASAVGLTMLPMAFLLLWMGLGLWGIVLTLFVGETLFNTVLIATLKLRDYPYVVPIRALLVLAGAAFLSWLLLYVIDFRPADWWSLALALAFSSMLFLFFAYLFKPFSPSERASINRLVNRKVFA